jgi:hypothetical protein
MSKSGIYQAELKIRINPGGQVSIASQGIPPSIRPDCENVSDQQAVENVQRFLKKAKVKARV